MNQSTFDYVPDEPEQAEEVVVQDNGDESFEKASAAAQEHDKTEAEPVQVQETDETKATDNALMIADRPQGEIIAMFSKEKGLDPIIKEIRARVESEVFDATTKDGDARIGSVARQIGSAKQELKRMGQAQTEEWRKATKMVTSEVSRMEKEMDELRDKVLESRIKEQRRKDEREGRIVEIQAQKVLEHDADCVAIQKNIDEVERLIAFDWHEFKDRAVAAHKETHDFLIERLKDRKKYEEEQAELERLRKQEEERKQREREKEIADNARKEAEEKAAAEKAEANKKRIDAHNSYLNRLSDTGVVSEGQSSGIYESRIAALSALYDREWEEFADKAKQTYESVNQELTKLLEAAKQTEERAAKEREQAESERIRKEEADRIEAEKKREADEKAKREADAKHKKDIQQQVYAALQDIQNQHPPQEWSRRLIEAIDQGKVPHIEIKY